MIFHHWDKKIDFYFYYIVFIYLKNKNNSHLLFMIMSTFSIRELFAKFQGHCNVFGKTRNDILFAEFIVKYLKYEFSHYVLIGAIRSFFQYLHEKNVIYYDIMNHTYMNHVQNDIMYLDDKEIEKYQNNLLEIIHCNAIIYHGGVIGSNRDLNKNITSTKHTELNTKNNEGDSDKEDESVEEQSEFLNVFNEYHMTNTFNTKFPTYWKEDKVEELKYYQSKEFWCKFVDYITQYSSDNLSNVFPVTENDFEFTSTNSGKKYTITVTETGFKCTCPDHVHRDHDCKHIKDFIKLVERFMNE